MGFETTAYDTKLRRETALLLHLGDLSVKEVLEHYKLDKDEYQGKLYVWKSRAKAQYERMDPIEQEMAHKEALERFYGKVPAAARMDMLKAPDAPQRASEEILEDDAIAEFMEDPLEVTEVLPADSTEAEHLQYVSNTDLTRDITHTPMVADSYEPEVLPTPVSAEAFDNSMQDLKGNGIKSIEKELKTLQNLTPSLLNKEINFLSRLFNTLAMLDLSELKPRDIKTLTETTEKLITLRRKALLLPFGHLDPNAKPTVNVSKQLHFHNHGLSGFDPNKE